MVNKLDRSWIDLLTNNATVTHDAPDTLANALMTYKLPHGTLFDFLHESTHHWCCDGLYGNLLFLLRTGTARKLRKMQTAHEAPDERVIAAIGDEHLRYQFMMRLYRPLLEGLALFAEHDTWPSPTEALPSQLIYATFGYSGLDRKSLTIAKAEKAYGKLLFDLRFSYGIGQTRKADLLISPYEITQSPYLAGYLFVKHVQRMFVRRQAKFSDPNLFLAFIKNYFFTDIELVAAVFDEQPQRHGCDALWDYFTKRVMWLEQIDLSDELVESFERDVIAKDFDPERLLLYVTEDQKQYGLALLEKISDAFFEEAESLEIAHFIKRRYFRQFMVPAYVQITEKSVRINVAVAAPRRQTKRVRLLLEIEHLQVIDGVYYKMVLSNPNYDALTPLNAVGECVNYVQFRGTRSCLCFFVEGKLIYHHALEAWQKGEIDLFRATAGQDDLRLASQIDADVQAFCAAYPEFAEREKKIYERYDPLIQVLYGDTGLDMCPDEHLAEVNALMARDGFWKVLGEDEELIELLALLSLINAGGIYDRENLNGLSALYDMDLESVLSRLRMRCEKYGLALLAENSDVVIIRGV